MAEKGGKGGRWATVLKGKKGEAAGQWLEKGVGTQIVSRKFLLDIIIIQQHN